MRLSLVFGSSKLNQDLSFPDVLAHRDTAAPLPLPEGWRQHLEMLDEMGLPPPRNIHSLDRAVAWVTLLDEVEFDLNMHRVSCRFHNDYTTTLPLPDRHAAQLHAIAHAYARAKRQHVAKHAACVAESCRARAAWMSFEEERRTPPFQQQRKRNKLVKPKRLSGRPDSEPPSPTSSTFPVQYRMPRPLTPPPHTIPAPPLPAWFRRTSRPRIIDLYRIVVVPHLSSVFWSRGTSLLHGLDVFVADEESDEDWEDDEEEEEEDADLDAERQEREHRREEQKHAMRDRVARAGPHYPLWTVRSVIAQLEDKIGVPAASPTTRPRMYAPYGDDGDPRVPPLVHSPSTASSASSCEGTCYDEDTESGESEGVVVTPVSPASEDVYICTHPPSSPPAPPPPPKSSPNPTVQRPPTPTPTPTPTRSGPPPHPTLKPNRRLPRPGRPHHPRAPLPLQHVDPSLRIAHAHFTRYLPTLERCAREEAVDELAINEALAGWRRTSSVMARARTRTRTSTAVVAARRSGPSGSAPQAEVLSEAEMQTRLHVHVHERGVNVTLRTGASASTAPLEMLWGSSPLVRFGAVGREALAGGYGCVVDDEEEEDEEDGEIGEGEQGGHAGAFLATRPSLSMRPGIAAAALGAPETPAPAYVVGALERSRKVALRAQEGADIVESVRRRVAIGVQPSPTTTTPTSPLLPSPLAPDSDLDAMPSLPPRPTCPTLLAPIPLPSSTPVIVPSLSSSTSAFAPPAAPTPMLPPRSPARPAPSPLATVVPMPASVPCSGGGRALPLPLPLPVGLQLPLRHRELERVWAIGVS